MANDVLLKQGGGVGLPTHVCSEHVSSEDERAAAMERLDEICRKKGIKLFTSKKMLPDTACFKGGLMAAIVSRQIREDIIQAFSEKISLSSD